MGIMAKEGAGSFRPVSEGLHPAVCVGVIDFGIQPGSDRFPKPKHKVHLRWVVLDEIVKWETREGEKKEGPALVGQTYTLTLAENGALRPLLESWRGRKFTPEELKGFDISRLAGIPCQVQVLHEHRGDKTYANVASIVSWPKGVPVPETALPPIVVYTPAEHDPKVFETLPSWMQEVIAGRLADNYEQLDQATGTSRGREEPDPFEAVSGGFNDDIPFALLLPVMGLIGFAYAAQGMFSMFQGLVT